MGSKPARRLDTAPGSIRVTAGRIKGRKLAIPEGLGVRPTSDRARETLFNILTNRFKKPSGEAFIVGARVFDAFAGTGALGLEAWSRGASFVAFRENNRAHEKILRENAKASKLPETDHRFLQGALGGTGEAFDIIFADPPYDRGQELVVAMLGLNGVSHAETLLVWERAKGDYDPLAGWREIHDKAVGNTVFSFQVPENASSW